MDISLSAIFGLTMHGVYICNLDKPDICKAPYNISIFDATMLNTKTQCLAEEVLANMCASYSSWPFTVPGIASVYM